MPDPYVDTTGTIVLPDGRFEHTFSQTFLSNAQKCPEQARAIYFREAKSGPTDSTALGTACHEGWEYGLYEKQAGNTASVSELVDVTHHALDNIGEWKYTKMSRKTVYDMVPRLMEGWHKDILPVAKPARIEQKFRVLLYSGKHRDIYVNGTIDMIDDEYDPWDWKTASRPYERWEKQRWAIQPTVYSYAIEHLFNEWAEVGKLSKEIDFTYGIVMYDGTTEIMHVQRNQEHVDWLKQQCSQLAWNIEHKIKPWALNDSGWWCGPKWCPKFAECKGAHIVSEGWATT